MASLPLRPQVIRTQDAPLLHAAPVAAVPSILVGGSTSSQSQRSESQSIQSRIIPISVASAACLMVTSWRARKRPCIRSQIARQGTLAKPGDSETPSNAVEEWLLSLDLPTPLKPILGSGAWASFAASLVQMFVVAGLSALGTLIEQGESPAFYAQKYPDSSGIILMLGFDHMYSCPLFLGLLAWLAASLIACTGTTQLPLAKRAQRFTFHSSAAMKRRGTFLMRMNCPVVPDKEVPASAERLQQLRTELKSRGFIVRADDEANPTQLAASRGLLGKFAPMAVHLALLLTLLGNTVGLVFGSSSEVLVGDGGYADIGKVLDAGRRIKGPLAVLSPNKGLLDSVFVRVDDFRIEYKDDGNIDQFYSKLAIEDENTQKEVYSDEIYVNKPLRYGGATIYQADWGIDRLQMFVNGFPIVVPCKAVPADGGERSWAAFLPLELVTAKDPSTVKQISKPKEGIVFIVNNMRNVQVYGSDQSLAGVLRSPLAKVEESLEGMPIQFGQEITVEGDNKLKLDRIVGATGLIVKNDPGVPFVYAGYALLMPATLLSVLPFVQVWAAINKDDDNQILVTGRANRNQLSFEDEMKATVFSVAK